MLGGRLSGSYIGNLVTLPRYGKSAKKPCLFLRPHVSAAIENDIALMKRQYDASQQANDIITLRPESEDREEQLRKVTLKVQGLNIEKKQLKMECIAADATYLEQLD